MYSTSDDESIRKLTNPPRGSLHLNVNHHHHYRCSIDRKSTRGWQCLWPRTQLRLLRSMTLW